jgi:hypothetical protein
MTPGLAEINRSAAALIMGPNRDTVHFPSW